MIAVIQYNNRHIEEINKWWEHYKYPPPPLHRLSKTGVVFEKSNEPIGAAWIYKTDSSIAYLDFAIMKPKLETALYQELAQIFIPTLETIVRGMGFRTTVVYIRIPVLMRRFEKAGYIRNSGNWIQYSKEL